MAMMQIMAHRPEFVLVWGHLKGAETMLVRVIRDYLYIDKYGGTFISRKCDDIAWKKDADDLDEDLDDDIGNSMTMIINAHMATMNLLLEQMVTNAHARHGVTYSERLAGAIGTTSIYIDKKIPCLQAYAPVPF